MSNTFNSASFCVSGLSGFDLSTALRLWKAKYPEFIDFKKDVITHASLKDVSDFVEESWDNIVPVTVEEALSLENVERRRVYFDCIGVQRLFKQMDPILRDRKVIKKKRAKWDDDNTEILYEFEDVYELYQLEGNKLFNRDRFGRTPNQIYAVRCWCTTTNREYWLYVDQEAATGKSWWGDEAEVEFDAIRAIAWTIRIDISPKHVEKIYRQGDIIVVKTTAETPYENIDCPRRHLTKEEYLSLMYSET